MEYFIGATVCNNLPIDVKDSKSIVHFKSKLRSVYLCQSSYIQIMYLTFYFPPSIK